MSNDNLAAATGNDTIEARLAAMGYTLPPPFVFPKNNRTGCTQAGKFGVDITVDEGYATARAVALTMLATIKAHCGSLDHVKRVLRLFGMVNCTPDFGQQPQVIDGASDLLFELFGPDAGKHARSAVGHVSLPRGIAVEINGEFELHPL